MVMDWMQAGTESKELLPLVYIWLINKHNATDEYNHQLPHYLL